MTRLLIGGALAALMVASVAAIAQPAPPTPPGVASGTAPALLPPRAPGVPQVRMMVRTDKVMTRDEVVKHVRDMFARLDTNRDGFITKNEVEALQQKMMGAMDRVGDIQQRLAERGLMPGDRGAMFDRLDTNHDNMISREEYMAARPQLREQRVMIMRGPDGALSAPGMAMPPMPPMPPMRGMNGHMHGMGISFGGHLFDMADANHDGRVSLHEAETAALAHFDRADLNHDGKITPDERQKVHETMRFERRQG